MALGDPYITRDQLKAYLKIADTQDDTVLDGVVADITSGIEDYCNRQFNLAGVESSRVYEPRSDGCVPIDDIASTSGLVIAVDTAGDGTYATTLTAAQYELRPLNGIVRGRAWPYTEIWPVDYTWPSWWRRAPIRVTTPNWGWLAKPAPVTQAAYILGNDTFGLRTARFGVAGFDQMGVVRVGTNKRAAEKLDPYRLHPVMVA